MTDEISTQIETPSSATSNMAVISLVAGVLGLTFFPLLGSIVAVITGPMAKREIIESGGELSGEGMATAGMVLGWIAIALMVFGLCIGAFHGGRGGVIPESCKIQVITASKSP